MGTKTDEFGQSTGWMVLDPISVRAGKKRIHEMMTIVQRKNGRQVKQFRPYTFEPGEYTEVPQDVAILFAAVANDDGTGAFDVRTPTGTRLRPAAAADDDGRVALKPGQVVAEVADLTDNALKDRATLLPGGDKLPKTVKRPDLINFVLAGGEEDEDEQILNKFGLVEIEDGERFSGSIADSLLSDDEDGEDEPEIVRGRGRAPRKTAARKGIPMDEAPLTEPATEMSITD